MATPNLIEMHNSAFSTLDKQLAKQGENASDSIEKLAKIETTQQRQATALAQDTQQEDRAAYEKSVSYIKSMPPDLQEQVLQKAMASPKFASLHQQFGGGVELRPNDFTTAERGERARSATIQDALRAEQTASIEREETARIQALDEVNGNPDLVRMKAANAAQDLKVKEMATFTASTDPEVQQARVQASVATRLGDQQAAVKFADLLKNNQTVRDGEIALQADKQGGLQRVRAEDEDGNIHDVTRAEATGNRWKIHGAVYAEDVEKLSQAKNPLIGHLQKMQKAQANFTAVLSQPNVDPSQAATQYLMRKDAVMPTLWNSFAVGAAALDKKLGVDKNTMSRTDAIRSRITQLDTYLNDEQFRTSEAGKKLYRNLKAEYEKQDLRNPLFLIIEDIKPMKYPDDPTDKNAPRLTRNARRTDESGRTALDIAKDMYQRCGLDDADTFLDSLYISNTTANMEGEE